MDRDSWGLLFFHPCDFAPVCTTELGVATQLKNEFELRRTKVLACSIDSLYSHRIWIKDINTIHQTKVYFPIIADQDASVTQLFLGTHRKNISGCNTRSVFIIDPLKQIRLIITYPASVGKNFIEILRVLDNLQLNEYEQIIHRLIGN
ncbi:redoxin domain-containing protein [Fulvivirga ligni]|uniref:redoxin domain-containing protein n=1 Tax=Fulvivirga ligni TaxID=2904246 RepID=UPI00278BB229|nr:redoxin domain-containing protein [Fulvivirga ligni]